MTKLSLKISCSIQLKFLLNSSDVYGNDLCLTMCASVTSEFKHRFFTGSLSKLSSRDTSKVQWGYSGDTAVLRWDVAGIRWGYSGVYSGNFQPLGFHREFN